MALEDTTTLYLICPKCGNRHRMIGPQGKGGEWACHKCGHVFAIGERVPLSMWTEVPVKAVKCDRCGSLVPCISENFASYTSPGGGRRFTVVACPNGECREHLRDHPNWIQPHPLALKYRGRWYSPKSFLRIETKVADR